jgi:hypothetical protein
MYHSSTFYRIYLHFVNQPKNLQFCLDPVLLNYSLTLKVEIILCA